MAIRHAVGGGDTKEVGMKTNLRLGRFVRFTGGSRMSSQDELREVTKRDPLGLVPPAEAYSFYFFDQVVGTVDLDDELIAEGEDFSCVEMKSEEFLPSKTYYCNGRAYTVAEIEAEIEKLPATDQFARTVLENIAFNMRENEKRAFRSNSGSWFVLYDDGILAAEAPAVE
jgi:hypothetical protein